MRATTFVLLFRQAAVLMFLLFMTTVTCAQITPSADAYISSANPKANYGADTVLRVNGATGTAFIQFDLASIPPGAVVSQATLKLFVDSVTTPGSFNVNYIAGPWSEGALSYELAPAIAGTITANVPITTEDKNQYILINVTPAVQTWLKDGEANNGIALVANGAFHATFDSKENAGTAHPPQLDIVFAAGSSLQLGDNNLVCVGAPQAAAIRGAGISFAGDTPSGSSPLIIGIHCSPGGGGGGGGTGTVTSVGLTAPSTDFVVTGSPVTTSGTLGLGWLVAPDFNDTPNAIVKRDSNGSFSAGAINVVSSLNLGGNVFDQGSYANGNAFLGFAGNATTTGTSNTATGEGALASNTSGNNNTATGQDALVFNTTGSNNTALGYNAGSDQNSPALTNATAIGANADVTQSNSLVLGSINGVNGATASTNVGIGTTAPQYTLDVNGTANFTGLVNFSPSQKFPGGSGTVTSVGSGAGLTGGPITSSGTLSIATAGVSNAMLANPALTISPGTGLTGGGLVPLGGTTTLNLDTTQVPLLNNPNTFTGNQLVNGNLSATGLVTGTAFNIGSNLFAFGSYANQNAFLGFAGNATTTGTSNTATGEGALASNTSGNNNTATGQDALVFNTTGSNNTALGYNAGSDQNSPALTNATAIGANADVTQSNSLVLGSINGVNGATASTNVGIGTTAPQYTLDVNGTANFTGLVNFSPSQKFPGGSGTVTSVGSGAGLTGGPITSSGTLSIATAGVSNAMLANPALTISPGTGLTGGGLVPLGGTTTLNLDTTQVPLLNNPNTFTGNQLVNGNLSATGLVTGTAFNIGSNLFAFGSYANQNAFLGFAGNATTTGTSNTATGEGALASNTSGNNNTATGQDALVFNTTGSNNTALGYNAGSDQNSPALTNATAIGANADVTQSNSLVLGSINGVNGATASTNVGIGTTAPQYTLD